MLEKKQEIVEIREVSPVSGRLKNYEEKDL